eukprot:347417-Chlamydomonas_euryale.AAC.6
MATRAVWLCNRTLSGAWGMVVAWLCGGAEAHSSVSPRCLPPVGRATRLGVGPAWVRLHGPRRPSVGRGGTRLGSRPVRVQPHGSQRLSAGR